MTPEELLDLPIGPNDAYAETLRDYLRDLLATLWSEGEDFSGKRPFGNSGWESEIINLLSEAGVEGNRAAIWNKINEAIQAI